MNRLRTLAFLSNWLWLPVFLLLFQQYAWGQEAAFRRAAGILKTAESAAREDGTREIVRTLRDRLQKSAALYRDGKSEEAAWQLEEIGRMFDGISGQRTQADARSQRLVRDAAAQTHRLLHSIAGFSVSVTRLAGQPLAGLVLGKTRLSEAERIFRQVDKRENGMVNKSTVVYPIGESRLHLAFIYRPPDTRYELYFDRSKRLVLVVDGGAYGSLTEAFLRRRYPTLKQTRSGPDWREMQADLGRCVTLIAVFSAGRDDVDSVGYAFECSRE